MDIHGTRLWIHRNYTPIKHWLFVIIGFILIAFALLSYANSNRLLKQVNVLAEQNKVLSQQNKKLNQETSTTGEATQKVVLQNRAYIQCLSDVFAKYTHNFLPITIDDLQNCVVQVGTSGAASPSKASSPASPSKTPTSSSASTSASNTSPKSSSGGGSSSSNSSTQAQPSQPNLLHRILNRIPLLN